MKKLAKLATVTLFAVLPLSAFAAEEPAQNTNTAPVTSAVNETQSSPAEILAKVAADIAASPELSAEIVQAAVEANPELAKQIIDAAVSAGADADEMLVAALLGGASEESLSEATAAGDNADLEVAVVNAAPQSTDFGGGTGSGSDANASNN